jgi:hypothetical protein
MSGAAHHARVARMGRRVGIVIFALLVAVPTLVWTVQILKRVFWAEPGHASANCHDSVLALERAVRRARLAAAKEADGERAALASFRLALEPEWAQRGAIGVLCQGDGRAERALSELDALRYAEEHAVRYEAVALARQRRRAASLEQELTRQDPPRP